MNIGTGSRVWKPELSNLGNFVCGEDCVIHSHVWIGNGVIIGHRCKIQAFCFLPDGVELEYDVVLGPRVTFTNDRNIERKGKTYWQKTLVKKGAKIGAGAVIVAGVTIGEGAFIGAGAVVTKDIPSGEVWVGNPARKKN